MSYERIEVTVSADGGEGLKDTTYRYILLDGWKMTLDYIVHKSRPTLRHKFRVDRQWCRINERDSTMPREEPPEAIRSSVISTLLQRITWH